MWLHLLPLHRLLWLLLRLLRHEGLLWLLQLLGLL